MSNSCHFYYEDSHRRSPKKECRLIERNPASAPWDDKLCRSCPVPEILEQNPCTHLALEADVRARFRFWGKVQVFAVCTARMGEISDPRNCRQSCEQSHLG